LNASAVEHRVLPRIITALWDCSQELGELQKTVCEAAKGMVPRTNGAKLARRTESVYIDVLNARTSNDPSMRETDGSAKDNSQQVGTIQLRRLWTMIDQEARSPNELEGMCSKNVLLPKAGA